MENSEVIYISSDDDEDIGQNKDYNKQNCITNQPKIRFIALVQKKDPTKEPEKLQTYNKKRKAIHLGNDVDISQVCKKIDIPDKKSNEEISNNYNDKKEEKIENEQNINKEKVKNEQDMKEEVKNGEDMKEEVKNEGDTKEGNTVLKPQLVIKEKIVISHVEQDVFPMFISLCLQKDHSEDMKTIVYKLKRRYEQLDSAYANSGAFINFLNQKRNDIMNSKKILYKHIADVMSEMKKSCQGKSVLVLNGKNSKISDAACPDTLNSETSSNNNTIRKATEIDSETYKARDDSTQKKINIILKTMKKCEIYITKLEEAEIDFDDENNSNYIKLERYKHRMVELYNKLCEYTGENVDAGRSHLRPKHFGSTGIVAVDQAITSFINSKFSKKHKLKKIGAFTNTLIFPDYSDILKCVTVCNEQHNLGLSNTKQQQIARKAFTDLGEHLQRSRRYDYWDTFSLFLEEKPDDPAVKDPELSEKLMENKKIGEKRLANIFEEYVRMQEAMKDQELEKTSENEDDSSEDEDEDVEINDDDDLTNVSNFSQNDDNSTDEDETSISEKKTSTDKIGTNVPPILLEYDIIEIEEREQTTDDETVKCTGYSLPVKTDLTVSICNNTDVRISKTTEKIYTPPISDTVLPESVSLSNTVLSTVTTNSIQTEEDKSINNNVKSMNNKSAESRKPLLRVCSFAKPPKTWEGVHQKRNIKINTLDTSVDNDIVTPVMGTQKENSTVVRSGTNKIEVTNSTKKNKTKTLVESGGKSITNVENITNNCVKRNVQSGGNMCNATKLPSVSYQSVAVLDQGSNHKPTVQKKK